ncbi:hypothetical protein Taro_005131 [Colocasia esculenta]|uniref:HTH La-type RNA-binding domain-containing protein n=1 Tax=Colocasia esculenta TaxID=4460 RepID=A0A843TK36_COLES|nr:hypothetical protein [Colocasia esculenta]
MTTATGEYAHLPAQFSALSIGDAGPREELPVADNAGVAQPAPRKAWRSPPRRALAEEPRSSSWPAPSRDGAHSRKKPPQPRSPEAAAMTSPAPSSPVESAPSGDPVAPAADPREQQQMEKGTLEERPRGLEPVAVAAPRADPSPPVATSNPRTARPPLLPVPRQQQGRPPQNGRRGRVPYHQNNGDHGGNGNGGGGHQHRRPRQHWNTVFSHQQPTQTQFVNDNFYHPMNQPMMGVPNLPQDWGFHPMPIMQWGPNPHLASPYMGALPPPVGPRFAEVFQYHSPPFPQYAPPPPGWSPSWLIPASPEATLQNQPQTPAVNTQAEGDDVGAKLRKQIEYYFSDENLIKDIYLKKCMDNQGWVSVHTIAEFPRIRSLTRDVGLVLGALQASDTVEILDCNRV